MRKLQNLGLWALVGATALMTLLVAAPAAAKTRQVTDGRDRPANVDIRSVTYRNGEARAGVAVRVRDLRPTGRLVALVGAPDSDVIHDATVWPRSDGTVGTRLALVTADTRTPRSCPTMTATWSPDADTVEVSVPHTCLDFDAFLERHFMKVKVSGSGNQDAARGVEVHELLDTAGRFGDGAAGGYSRIYRSCSGGKPWFVGYDGTTHTLVAKGRVR